MAPAAAGDRDALAAARAAVAPRRVRAPNLFPPPAPFSPRKERNPAGLEREAYVPQHGGAVLGAAERLAAQRVGLRRREAALDLQTATHAAPVRRSPLLALAPAVSWPWVPAWGSLEPPRRAGENAQKTRKNGEEMAEIQPKKCEGRELTKDQLEGNYVGAGAAPFFRNVDEHELSKEQVSTNT